MAATDETNLKSSNFTPYPGDDTAKNEMIKAITELSEIRIIKDFFLQSLSQAREKFEDEIKEFYRLKDNPDQMEEEGISELSKAFEKNKTYFFEMIRVEDPKREFGVKWSLGRFKLKANGKVVNIILDDFIKNADQYEVNPQRIQEEIVDIPSLNKKFWINFTKSSSSRIVGFVKEYKIVEEKAGEKGKEEKEEEKFVLKKNRNMLKLVTKGKKSLEIEKEELEELLQYNPEFTDDMFFSIRMKQALDRH